MRAPQDPLKTFDIQIPPPPSIPAPEKVKGPEGAASPPSREARPTPVVAPKGARRSPVRAAAKAEPLPTGSAPTAGASSDPGPGSGAGGQGSGASAGRGGSGTGGGGLAARAQRISGQLSDRDHPDRGRRDRIETVSVRFTIRTDGSVGGCIVTRSSGSPRVDATTCRVIEQRFRYRPARDLNGNPVSSVMTTTFDWIPPGWSRH